MINKIYLLFFLAIMVVRILHTGKGGRVPGILFPRVVVKKTLLCFCFFFWVKG